MDEQDLVLLVHCDHGDRAVVFHHLPCGHPACRHAYPVDPQRHHRPVVHQLGIDHREMVCARGVHREATDSRRATATGSRSADS